MLEVRTVDSPPRPVAIEPPVPRQAKAPGQNGSGDRVEISAAGRQAALIGELARRVLDLPEERPALIEAARGALQRGELDTPAALLATVHGMTRDTLGTS